MSEKFTTDGGPEVAPRSQVVIKRLGADASLLVNVIDQEGTKNPGTNDFYDGHLFDLFTGRDYDVAGVFELPQKHIPNPTNPSF